MALLNPGLIQQNATQDPGQRVMTGLHQQDARAEALRVQQVVEQQAQQGLQRQQEELERKFEGR